MGMNLIGFTSCNGNRNIVSLFNSGIVCRIGEHNEEGIRYELRYHRCDFCLAGCGAGICNLEEWKVKEYEKDEYVFVPRDNETARIIRIFQNGDDPLYEIVFESGLHKIVRPDEIEKENPKGIK